jgi:hypothetical protein
MAWRDQDFSRNRWARDENELGAIPSRLNRGGFSLTESAITGDTGEVTPIGLSPFIRENDINFAARNLKPEALANLFFDATPVNRFAQRASTINVSSSSVLTSVKVNEGIYATTSRAYAEVLGTSRTGTQNLIYVNDNFITIKVTKGAGSADLGASDYRVDDLVYQTAAGTALTFTIFDPSSIQPNFSFLGKVKKWEVSSATVGYLVVEPILGNLKTTLSDAAAYNVWNLSTFIADAREATITMANNRFQNSESIVNATSGASIGTLSGANAYIALSSSVTGANTNNLRSIVISSNNTTRDGISTIVGNTITIVSGTNMGFKANVVAVAANTANGWNEAIIDANLPELCTSNSVYSIGEQKVDDVGSLFGIFHIPSESNLKWLTGERVFTITDTATHNDNDYKMRAITKYTALGKTNTAENARNFVLREQTPNTQQAEAKIINETTSVKINDRKYMAQTFFTPKGNSIVNGQVKNAYGVFMTSVDLFFKEKPTNNDELLPFTVAISKVENGLPSNDIIAERTLEPGYINTSTNPSLSNTSTLTKFTFTDPVYLLPATEYCIKLITESPDYQVWTAELGGEYTDETGNKRRISEQPYVGNFFKSMNASNWNPILNQDLMFRVNRASFATTPSEVYFNLVPSRDLQSNTIADLIKIQVTEQQFSPTSVNFEVETFLTDGTSAGFIKIDNNEIYNFGKDTNISSASAKRRRLIPAANVNAVNVKVTMATSDDSVAPIINRERFAVYTLQNIINNAGIANNLISITNSGSHANAANIAVTISNPDVGSNRATANVLPSMLSSGKVTGINIINPGAGYFTSPTVSISEAAATSNATAIVNGETDISGGNIIGGKYQTKIVTLEDGFDAGDLIVRMNAIKPQGTNIAVYFKVLSALDSDPFVTKKWQKMRLVKEYTSPDQVKTVPLEFRYTLDKGSITYFDGARTLPLGGKFKYFAVKIRLTAEDPTVVPAVESLRVVAVPGG